jgi:hypothetical protein
MNGARVAALCSATFVVGIVFSQIVSRHSTLPTSRTVRADTAPIWVARGFYLTKNLFPPSGALKACASPGYHMASLWEISDVSTLKYDTQLGFTLPDSGSGPPAGRSGWIRTGSSASKGAMTPGQANCNGWTDDALGDWGSAVYLNSDWTYATLNTTTTQGRATDTPILPWLNQYDVPQPAPGGRAQSCSAQMQVWCVQD